MSDTLKKQIFPGNFQKRIKKLYGYVLSAPEGNFQVFIDSGS
jgi:hypothetical protein